MVEAPNKAMSKNIQHLDEPSLVALARETTRDVAALLSSQGVEAPSLSDDDLLDMVRKVLSHMGSADERRTLAQECLETITGRALPAWSTGRTERPSIEKPTSTGICSRQHLADPKGRPVLKQCFGYRRPDSPGAVAESCAPFQDNIRGIDKAIYRNEAMLAKVLDLIDRLEARLGDRWWLRELKVTARHEKKAQDQAKVKRPRFHGGYINGTYCTRPYSRH